MNLKIANDKVDFTKHWNAGKMEESKNILLLYRFLPRDTMHKRGLCRHAVRVCLSRS